ncbi:hypothetical protein Adt_08214 [Abeliophyllum distichum]|uniref:Uncharacterized protein n=1 Tax=Abeliophyllum distichum TaxID=126358 RepID=A0ABD1VDD9_9LAMI
MSHNMSNELRLIREVSLGTTGWTVNVTVAEKFSPRIAQEKSNKVSKFNLNGLREVGDTDKGKAPVKDVEDIDLANTHPMEPIAKRSLFHSDSDDAHVAKTKFEKSRVDINKKISEFVVLRVGVGKNRPKPVG